MRTFTRRVHFILHPLTLQGHFIATIQDYYIDRLEIQQSNQYIVCISHRLRSLSVVKRQWGHLPRQKTLELMIRSISSCTLTRAAMPSGVLPPIRRPSRPWQPTVTPSYKSASKRIHCWPHTSRAKDPQQSSAATLLTCEQASQYRRERAYCTGLAVRQGCPASGHP